MSWQSVIVCENFHWSREAIAVPFHVVAGCDVVSEDVNANVFTLFGQVADAVFYLCEPLVYVKVWGKRAC